MKFLIIVKHTINIFKRLWQEKIFRIALIIHSGYFILSLLLFFLVLNQTNDFIIFYQSGKIFLSDLQNLYDQSKYLWEFRYFPLSALLFVPFSFLNFGLAFVLFSIINLILNFIILLLIYELIKIYKGSSSALDSKKTIRYLSLYLMAAPHILNYIYGQVNLIITCLLLFSLFIFTKKSSYKWQIVASAILGLSVIIKPTSIFLIPFLITLRLNITTKKIHLNLKESSVRILGALLPLSLNFVLFFLYPNLWNGFITTNFTGSSPSALNFSFSLTKIVTNLFYMYDIPNNQLFVLLTISGIFGLVGFIAYIIQRETKYSLLYGYILGILTLFLGYFDTWDHHLLNLIPFLIILLLINQMNPLQRYQLKWVIFFFSFFDIVFVGYWYLTYQLFPYNFIPTVFLLLTYYVIIKIMWRERIMLNDGDSK
jgi:hypothetical protein